MKVLEEQAEGYTNDTVWDALKASSQEPNPVDITSNTQWSIAYNNTGRNRDSPPLGRNNFVFPVAE